MTTTYDTDADTCWICYRCGELDHLNTDGLCHDCAPEPVATEFYQICVRVLVGEVVVRSRTWTIK